MGVVLSNLYEYLQLTNRITGKRKVLPNVRSTLPEPVNA